MEDIIIEELSKSPISRWYEICYQDKRGLPQALKKIADNIISKLPKEEVIAEGKLENIGISPNGVVYTIFKNLKWPHKDISNIIGKNIRLKIEVIE